MSDKIIAWPSVAGRPDVALPKRIKRPADYGLELAIMHLETELGTIEAYNRLATATHKLKASIESGNAKPQNPLYAINPSGGDGG